MDIMGNDAKAAFFDADGTLFDSREAFGLMILELTGHFGIQGIEERDFQGLLGRTDPEIAQALIPADWPDRGQALQDFVKLANQRWIEFYFPRYVKAFIGARRTLEKLKEMGYTLGVVSNANGEELPVYLEYGHMEGLVDIMVSADDVAHPKPAPDALLEACLRASAKPERTFYAGDTQIDILAARAAHCLSVAVLTGVGKPEEMVLAGPDFIVASVSSLFDILKDIDCELALAAV